MTEEEESKVRKWDKLSNAYRGLSHVPKIKDLVAKEFYFQTRHNGMDRIPALEEALIKHAFYADTRPMVMRDGMQEYEDIMEGEKIWQNIK